MTPDDRDPVLTIWTAIRWAGFFAIVLALAVVCGALMEAM